MAFLAFSFGFLKTFKAVAFFFGFANGLVVVGAYLMLSTVTTMADDAYAVIFLHQQKLRQDLIPISKGQIVHLSNVLDK